MKGMIAILLMLGSIGCATPYARLWQSKLGQVQDNTTENPELGKLEMEDLAFDILCTELRQVWM